MTSAHHRAFGTSLALLALAACGAPPDPPANPLPAASASLVAINTDPPASIAGSFQTKRLLDQPIHTGLTLLPWDKPERNLRERLENLVRTKEAWDDTALTALRQLGVDIEGFGCPTEFEAATAVAR